MDSNLIFSIFLIIILTIIAIEWDEGFILCLIGCISIALSINLELAFSIDNSTYQGFGQLIQLIFAFIGIFAFAKTYFTVKTAGFDPLFGRLKNRGN